MRRPSEAIWGSSTSRVLYRSSGCSGRAIPILLCKRAPTGLLFQTPPIACVVEARFGGAAGLKDWGEDDVVQGVEASARIPNRSLACSNHRPGRGLSRPAAAARGGGRGRHDYALRGSGAGGSCPLAVEP